MLFAKKAISTEPVRTPAQQALYTELEERLTRVTQNIVYHNESAARLASEAAALHAALHAMRQMP